MESDKSGGMLSFDEEAGRKLEAMYRTREARARRQALRDALRLQPGTAGLYIGSGPGLAPCEIAAALGPRGHLTVLEKNPAMITLTRMRAVNEGLQDRIELLEGDAEALPFADQSFAFAGAAQVLEYVPNVELAIAELHRVVKPGGLVALIDTDWQTLIWQSADTKLGARIAKSWEGHLAHNHLPRRLKFLLSRAGFKVQRVEPLVILNVDYEPEALSYMLLEIVADYVRSKGDVLPEEVDSWIADIKRQHEDGSYFFNLTQYLFVAERPS